MRWQRLTALGLTVAGALALACEGASDRWVVTVNGSGTPERVRVVRYVNDTRIEDTVRLPKTWRYGTGTDVRVLVSTPTGVVGCLIKDSSGTAVATDSNPDRQFAQCEVERRAER